jgi:Ni,Fe-hydrogenase III large subunit
LQVLENSKFNVHLTEEKLLHLESFVGVLERKIDNIESYRDFKEKRYEELKQKVGIIISATLISIFVFSIGYCCGVLQWK